MSEFPEQTLLVVIPRGARHALCHSLSLSATLRSDRSDIVRAQGGDRTAKASLQA